MFDDFNVDEILNGALKKESLKELFERKLEELKLSPTGLMAILNIPSRTVKGILDGTQNIIDVNNIVKIADFLQLPKEQVFKIYVESLQKKKPAVNGSPEKIKFIKENFDLTVLKKAGLIESLTDYKHIEERITKRLGYKSIYEYKKPETDVAFSSGLFKPKNILTRLFWIKAAMCTLGDIENPYEYNRELLIKFFPQIRWHTMNTKRGLTEVIKSLYKIGITVIFQPPLQGLQLRGATFNINENPCIVLTNYKGFYSTLWFCLLHELYHVLFDWNDIKNDCYHLTDDDNDELTVQEREKEADIFAGDYLFSSDKLNAVKTRLNDPFYIKKVAENNHVDPSIIYAAYAFENNDDRKAWARTKRYSPDIINSIKEINYPWNDEKPIEEFVIEKKQEVYN